MDEGVLKLIGDRVCEVRTLGPAIHADFVVRWEDIIKQGLPTDSKKELIKKYPPPENCTLIDPPKLNQEIKIASKDKEGVIKRDSRIVVKQEKITACLAAVGKTLSLLSDKKERSQEYLQSIEYLSDVNKPHYSTGQWKESDRYQKRH